MTILVAENEKERFEVIRNELEFLDAEQRIDHVRDGKSIMHHLSMNYLQKRELPGLLLLKAELTDEDCLKVLELMQANPHFRFIPAIVYTFTDHPHPETEYLQLGAGYYRLTPSPLSASGTFAQWIRSFLTKRDNTNYSFHTGTKAG